MKFQGLFLLFMIMFFSSSCLQKEEEVETLKNAKPEVNQSFSLKFGHDMPIDSAQHIAAMEFAKRVGEKSKGKVTVKVFPNQELGTDQKMIALARKGDLAIILPPTAKLSTLIPSMQFLDIPFLFDTRESIYEFLDGNEGKVLLKAVNPFGLIGVAFWESGFKQFTANKEIRSPVDFKMLNVRTMKSPLIADQFRFMEANPIPIEFHKTYQALADKAVDAQENSLTSIVNLKLYEHQSHLILSNHAYLGQMFCLSEKVISGLPDDVKKILIETAKELVPFQREEVEKKEVEYIKEIEKLGVKLVTLEPNEREIFSQTLRPLLEKYRQDIGTGFIEKVSQNLDEKKGLVDDVIYIGLDADLTAQGAPSGLAIKRGMELAIEEINREGGVLGKKLKILSRDHSGISARGIENIKYFSNIGNLVAVVGGLHSPVALSELEIIHEKKIIYLDPWAAATHIVDNGYKPNFVFRVSVRDKDAGGFFVREALKNNYRKIALLLENTGWGRSNEDAITSALQKENLKPALVEWFNWGETNFEPQLTRLRDAGADVILLVANATEGIKIIRALLKLQISLPIISHWGITGGEFSKEIPEELSKTNFQFLQTFSFVNSNREKAKEIIKAYKKKYFVESEKEIVAPVGTAHAYDMVHLLAKAINVSGSFERSAVRDALETIKSHRGLIKDYSHPFTPEDHDALSQKDFFLAQYGTNGAIIPISEN